MTSDPDFDTCVFCGAPGCATGTAEHAEDCPSETGLYPVTERDLRPICPHCGKSMDGPPGCCQCHTVLNIGDYYVHREIHEGVYEVLCVGCAAPQLAPREER